MKTNVKIPKFLEKFLNVYAVVTVGIGFIAIVLINSPYLKSLTKDVEAFPSEVMAGCWTSGYPNPWGSGVWGDPRWRVGSYEVVGNSYIEIPEGVYTISTYARWHTDGGSPAAVSAFAGLYSPPFGGPRVAQSGTQNFTVNPGADGVTNSWSFSYDFRGKCQEYQIDFSDPSAPWDSRCGAIFKIVGCEEPPPRPECGDGVLDSGEECDPPGNTGQCQYGDRVCRSDCTCPDQPPPDSCPYSSTEARVQQDDSHPWSQQITIQRNGTFRIGSFHNASGTFADNTRIVVRDPNEATIRSCNTSGANCNGYVITAAALGTYTVSVGTYNLAGGFYSEPACNAAASVIVQEAPPPPQRGFRIEKNVRGATVYRAGDTITFDITISNTGQVVLDRMLFIDRYNPNHLTFSSISGRRASQANVNLRSYIDPQNPNGEYRITDLTTHLGDLGVGESYFITVTYIARTVNQSVTTCNVAIADDGVNQYQDDACVTINPPPPPPPTDK